MLSSRLILVFFCFGLCACEGAVSQPDPTMHELRSRFSERRESFEQLHSMLATDLPGDGRCSDLPRERAQRYGNILEVSADRVCGFMEWEGRWSKMGGPDSEQNLTEAEMLQFVGMTQARYERYLELLDAAGAERVALSDRTGRPRELSLFVQGAGYVTSSYYVNIVHREEPPEPIVEDVFAYKAEEGYGTYQVYSALDDDWYVELDMQW